MSGIRGQGSEIRARRASKGFTQLPICNFQLAICNLRRIVAATISVLACSCVGSHLSADAITPASQASISEPPIVAADREHWSFRPLVRPIVPTVQNPTWTQNAIDNFILAEIETAGLNPAPQADRATLLRRVTFDLTGLPPNLEEQEAFLADKSDGAYERVVDRLLASDAYGERWAQHWLDLARFAETDGFEFDTVRPNAWRYRDWVIRAINDDLPYDEFVRLQLAGDEISPDDPDALAATGFLLCGPDMPDINLQEERRHVFLNDMTGNVGSVFMALQIGCAECHNHKFDPISQLDFYRLRACFDNLDMFRDHPVATAAQREIIARQMAAHKERVQQIDSQMSAIKQAVLERIRTERSDPKLEMKSAELVKLMGSTEKGQHAELLAKLDQVKRDAPSMPMGRVAVDQTGNKNPSRLYLAGDFRRPGPLVTAAFPRIANPGEINIPSLDNNTTGRRLALATWITTPDHPLTTRVIVNRLWQHHFGRGLSNSPSDFGIMGEEPTHPELLDWLATELPRRGWSVKQLHRLIVTSATYQLASRVPAESDAATEWKRLIEADPNNRLLARMSRRRLDGESIRDAMLASTDSLSQRRGGPGIRPPLPAELVSTLLKDQWEVSPNRADHDRRSIYLFVRRNLRYPFLEVFDRPDTNASCAQRNRSTIAPQALTLMNSEFSLAQSELLAKRIAAMSGSETDLQIATGYQLALGRVPTDFEQRIVSEYLATDSAAPSSRNQRLVEWCLALFNLNEFVYVD